MSIEWVIVGFVVFVTLGFIGIALIFPEFVGITGKWTKAHYDAEEKNGAAPAGNHPENSQDSKN